MAGVSKLKMLRSILGFFIGIFGAMAILGVFFKIMKWGNYEFYMQVGFIGEAAAFIVMGLFELMGAFSVSSSKESDAQSKETFTAVDAGGYFKNAIEAKIDHELDAIIQSVAHEIKRFQVEMHELGLEMGHTRTSVYEMRTELQQVASGNLAKDSQQLAEGMRLLGGEMESAGGLVESMRNHLETMAARFTGFNGSNRSQPANVDREPVSHKRTATTERVRSGSRQS